MDKVLSQQIKKFMAEKIAEGISLSEIQNMVNAEFNQHLTYMDIRIMASELEVDWQKLNPASAAPAAAAPVAAPAEAEVSADAEEDIEPAEDAADTPGMPEAPAMPDLSDTSIEVSKIARPGMMFSGSVVFANGSSADWYLDNMGRLGVENLQGDKPSEDDVAKFQMALQLELRKLMGR